MEMECEVVMSAMQEARTVTVKACTMCNGGLLEYDKFCRWCGQRQPGSVMTSGQLNDAQLTDSASIKLSPFTTSALERADAKAGLYRSVSGPLVNAVVAGVSANSPQLYSRFMKRAIMPLISIPIWLIILLLSPLDAYAAAKNLLREN
jgi:hypothetical protein